MQKRLILTVSALVICLLISIYYNYNNTKENSGYESYISQELSNNVGVFTSSTVSALDILNQAITHEEISYVDLSTLGSNFRSITYNLQDIEHINLHLKSVDLKDTNFVRANSSFSDFVEFNLDNKFSDSPEKTKVNNNETISLTNKEVEKLIKIQKLYNNYINILDETVVGIDKEGINDIYNSRREGFVTHKDWKILMQKINEVTTSEYIIRTN